MSQLAPSYDTARPKFLLASLALIILGATFMILPVQAVETINSIPNTATTSSYTSVLGFAQQNYIVTGSVSATGSVHVIVTNIDTDAVLLDSWVSNTVLPISQIVPQAGTVQVRVAPLFGASASFTFALTHQTTAYPLLIPGVALLLLGAVIIMTRVFKVGITVASPAAQPVQTPAAN